MEPTHGRKLVRLSACRSDLLDNGINLDGTDHRQLCGLVRRHLEYFQVMLGYQAGLREVVALVEDARGPEHGGGGPGGGPGGGRRGSRGGF